MSTVLRQAIYGDDNGGLFYLIADERIKENSFTILAKKTDAQVKAGTL